MSTAALPVLLVEDSEHDIVATKRAWARHKIEHPLVVVRDGEECLDYLYHRNKYQAAETAPRPLLILLDLNLPKIDGLTVLQQIRADKDLQGILIIILTTSQSQEERSRGYSLGVTRFLRKSVDYEKFSLAIKGIQVFLQTVSA
jgi:two-component system, response regulator